MKKLVLLLLLLNSLFTYSQRNINSTENQKTDSLPKMRLMAMDTPSDGLMPKIIPPSPEVSSIFKFINYPVSHSTGIPEISIPLYTVKCGDLSLPISIDYHASGRMFSDLTGPVGIGWTLNAGGTISRTVFGFPDEEYPVPEYQEPASSLNIQDDYLYLAEFYYKGGNDPLGDFKDSEYDLFSYSLPGMSGSFVMCMNWPKSLTLNGVKIEGSVDCFTITGEDGTLYTFRDYGNSGVSASYIDYNNGMVKTSWFLNEIKSADGKHTIRLTYEGVKLYNTPNVHFPMTGETMIVNDMINGDYYYGGILPVEYQNTYMELSFSSMRLKEINFESGKVMFENEAIGGKLKKIYIKDSSGTTVKTYSLTQALLDRTIIDNYKLESIATTSGSNQTDTYRFDYYPTSSSFTVNQHDYWGYLNDNKASMSYLIPTMELFCDNRSKIVGHATVTREANEEKMKSGVLKKITYPTGSNTEFIYEINKFKYANQIRNCGGLRVKQIKTTDDTGQIQLRTFEYCPYNSGCGSLATMYNMSYWGFESLYLDVYGSTHNPGTSNYNGHYRQRVFSSEFPQDYSYYANQPIFYYNVIEYKGDATNNTGKIYYHYDDPFSDSYVNNIPSPIYNIYSYPSYYPNFMPRTFEYGSYYSYISQFGSLWKDRSLTSQIEYERINETYNEVRSTTYAYTDITAEPLTGLKIFKYIQIPNDDYNHQTEEFIARDLGLPVFQFADYSITRGRRILSSVNEKETHKNGSISTTRNYTYDSNYLLKSVITTNSSGEIQLEETSYPTDSEYQNQVVYAKMINLNMLNIPLKQKLTRNGKSISNLTTYADLGGNYIKPSGISTQKDNNAAEVRIQYNKYDNYGNPISIVKDNAINIIYLWGYNGMYPVAEIINATYTEVQTALGITPESISSSTIYDSRIDNLRSRLPNAQVTIYKYKKLVGPSSVTSPNGVTTYYNYDSFNRLQKISIQEPGGSEKIIETYQYHYKTD